MEKQLIKCWNYDMGLGLDDSIKESIDTGYRIDSITITKYADKYKDNVIQKIYFPIQAIMILTKIETN